MGVRYSPSPADARLVTDYIMTRTPPTRTMTHLPDPRRKRLLFRSWHRGTREADLILGSFADQHLRGFDEAQLDRYEALLDVPDPDIFDWITGRAAPPAECDHDVTRLLLAFRYQPRPT
jgi:antitoxin CptB